MINESGLYSLILRSKKIEAKAFKRWVTSEVLPELRKTGKYEVSNPDPYMKTRIEVLDVASRLLSIGGISDRDKLLLQDLTRNVIINDKSSIKDIEESNKEWSISRRLQEKFLLNYSVVKKRVSQFGKLVKRRYVEINEREPPTREQFVDGTVRSVNCYYSTDYEMFIDEMILSYFESDLKGDVDDDDKNL